MSDLSCFKAYDIRGQLGTQLTEDVVYDIGRAYAEVFKPRTIVVGGDARETSPVLKMAYAEGLMDAGVDVIDIGMVGTEEIYFATSHLGLCGGVEVTASHNPIDYNGIKMVREGSRPISADTGLADVKKVAEKPAWTKGELQGVTKGSYKQHSNLTAYVDHLMTYVDLDKFTPIKLVINSGNGAAGHVIDEIETRFKAAKAPIEIIKVHNQPDATFPNGIPNPLLPENRADTADAVKKHGADLGIAFDGDFDRCFFFDETGDFVDGYYVVGLLGEAFLAKNPGQKVIYDPRVYWNTQDIVEQAGGQAIVSKSGHSFIKQKMREEDAVYGGEMSAHHYFRDFFYCDSGMIPWLLIAELLCVKGQKMSALVKDRIQAFPSSGEINFKVADAAAVFDRVEKFDFGETPTIGRLDGIDLVFTDWRMNLRSSNTEPVIRLNVESRGDAALLAAKLAVVKGLIY